MTTQYWLVKSEPEAYSWQTFVSEGRAEWTGVRNYQARNNLAAMRAGDRVLFYHSVSPREVVGAARVTRPARPDPTADDPRWVSVELAPGKAFLRPVPLQEIKAQPRLKEIALLRQSRLSVLPLTKEEYACLERLGSETTPR